LDNSFQELTEIHFFAWATGNFFAQKWTAFFITFVPEFNSYQNLQKN
jgi:hypothetical protein